MRTRTSAVLIFSQPADPFGCLAAEPFVDDELNAGSGDAVPVAQDRFWQARTTRLSCGRGHRHPPRIPRGDEASLLPSSVPDASVSRTRLLIRSMRSSSSASKPSAWAMAENAARPTLAPASSRDRTRSTAPSSRRNPKMSASHPRSVGRSSSYWVVTAQADVSRFVPLWADTDQTGAKSGCWDHPNCRTSPIDRHVRIARGPS